MVRPGMRRYRVRTERHATLIGVREQAPLDMAALFGDTDARAHPLRLEIGFGHGEFISAMAMSHPDERFIGVEHDELRVTKTRPLTTA
jgi:tRNA G46 methylase TrmB